MEENSLKAVGLAILLGLSKGTVSKILNYQKGLSKETIRKLSEYFHVSQEAFNRPYKLKNEINRQFRDASLMNTKKDLGLHFQHNQNFMEREVDLLFFLLKTDTSV
ncbi:helix-turn-helix domain-containing protein [Draconibacterium orientale]|uniref:helix-turn-helix domain-containing protein n=1 Tax=Draconibacterium orientale TaxID=1168034 RepID=UPI0029C0D89B|nr:helix-turn-helix domain-containing protein [Draconibacterium orientale]